MFTHGSGNAVIVQNTSTLDPNLVFQKAMLSPASSPAHSFETTFKPPFCVCQLALGGGPSLSLSKSSNTPAKGKSYTGGNSIRKTISSTYCAGGPLGLEEGESEGDELGLTDGLEPALGLKLGLLDGDGDALGELPSIVHSGVFVYSCNGVPPSVTRNSYVSHSSVFIALRENSSSVYFPSAMVKVTGFVASTISPAWKSDSVDFPFGAASWAVVGSPSLKCSDSPNSTGICASTE